jgi:hypothetical protein
MRVRRSIDLVGRPRTRDELAALARAGSTLPSMVISASLSRTALHRTDPVLRAIALALADGRAHEACCVV